MNIYATAVSETANGEEGFRNTAFHSVDSTYENYSIKKHGKATEEKAKVKSANQTNFKKIVLWILVFVSFAAFATCCGLIGKMLSDFSQEKLNNEKALNKVQSELMEYINQLNQTIKYQNEIINEYSNVISNVEDQQSEVDKNLQTLNEMTNKTNENLINGYVMLDDDWVAPLNGYQYKFVRTRRSWDDARSYCQSYYGADLASFGVQSIKVRRILIRAFGTTNWVWIGLNDLTTEGTWRWLSSSGNWDGDYATEDISLWRRIPPPSSSSYHCATLFPSSAYAHPTSCSLSDYFLCEKQYK